MGGFGVGVGHVSGSLIVFTVSNMNKKYLQGDAEEHAARMPYKGYIMEHNYEEKTINQRLYS